LKAWGFIPARGGSKSIPYKNLVKLGKISLIEKAYRTALKSGCFERIICSTEDKKIMNLCLKIGCEVVTRPQKLSGDHVKVSAVVQEFLKRQNKTLPKFIFLLQPTSPFLRVRDIKNLYNLIRKNPSANSGQTIFACPHNFHAWNQRSFRQGLVTFVAPRKRKKAFVKQKKPSHFIFGNLVAARVTKIKKGEDFFCRPSIGLVIDQYSSFDLDTKEDLLLARKIASLHRPEFN